MASGGRNTSDSLHADVETDSSGNGGSGGLSAKSTSGQKGEDLNDRYFDYLPDAAGGGGGAGGWLRQREWGHGISKLGRFVAPGSVPASGACSGFAAGQVIDDDVLVSDSSQLAQLLELRCVSGDLWLHVPGAVSLANLQIVAGDLFLIGDKQNATGQGLSQVSLPALTQVGGDLALLENRELLTFSADQLAQLGGKLALINNAALTELNLSINSAAGLTLRANSALQNIYMTQLVQVGGPLIVDNNLQLQNLDILNIQTVVGDIFVVDNSALGLLIADQLSQVSGKFFINNNNMLAQMSARALTDVGTSAKIQRNPALIRLNLPALQHAADIFLYDNTALSVLDLSALVDAQSIHLVDNGQLVSPTFTHLQTVDTFFAYGHAASGISDLGLISFPMLTQVNSLMRFGDVDYTGISAPLLDTVNDFGINTCGQLSRIDFAGLGHVLGYFYIIDNPQLLNCSALALRSLVVADRGIQGASAVRSNLSACSGVDCGGTLSCTEDCSIEPAHYVCE